MVGAEALQTYEERPEKDGVEFPPLSGRGASLSLFWTYFSCLIGFGFTMKISYRKEKSKIATYAH